MVNSELAVLAQQPLPNSTGNGERISRYGGGRQAGRREGGAGGFSLVI